MLRSYRLEGIQFQCCWNKVLYVGATTKDDGAVGGDAVGLGLKATPVEGSGNTKKVVTIKSVSLQNSIHLTQLKTLHLTSMKNP